MKNDFQISAGGTNFNLNPNPMNKIILPPSILSALMPNRTHIVSQDNHLYLLRENYPMHKATISDLYRLLFGKKPEKIKNEISDGPIQAEESYFSSYE
jgi:hypothetical protein